MGRQRRRGSLACGDGGFKLGTKGNSNGLVVAARFGRSISRGLLGVLFHVCSGIPHVAGAVMVLREGDGKVGRSRGTGCRVCAGLREASLRDMGTNARVEM